VGRPKVHDEALRSRLLERAAAIAFERGMDALSLRRLASDAGTSTTAVYSLFGNKAGLVDGLFQQATRRFAAALATVEPGSDPAEDVVRLGLAYRDYAVGEPHLYAIMFGRRDDGLPDEQAASAAATIVPLVDAVRRAQEAGRFEAGPPERIALACWATAHGLVSLELAGTVPPGLDIAAWYEDALRAMAAGWRM
jgi:AcrR family transcriptional regulator